MHFTVQRRQTNKKFANVACAERRTSINLWKEQRTDELLLEEGNKNYRLSKSFLKSNAEILPLFKNEQSPRSPTKAASAYGLLFFPQQPIWSLRTCDRALNHILIRRLVRTLLFVIHRDHWSYYLNLNPQLRGMIVCLLQRDVILWVRSGT